MTPISHPGFVEVEHWSQEWEEQCICRFHDQFFAVYGETSLLRDLQETHQKYLETSNKCFNRFKLEMCNQNLTIIAPYASYLCLYLVWPYGHTKYIEMTAWSACHDWNQTKNRKVGELFYRIHICRTNSNSFN